MSFSFAAGQFAEAASGPLLEALIANTGSRRTHTAQTPPGLYALALRMPMPPYLPIAIYTFPLSPSQITREVVGMGNYYDVLGSPQNFGVNRIADMYGQSPPIYTIAGTTGVKYHSADNFLWSGLESIELLMALISQYFSLNASQAQSNSRYNYVLEFYDYYMGQFWQVVPFGPQRIMQSSNKPQLVFYQIRLVATLSLEQAALSLIDSIFSGIQSTVGSQFAQSQTTLGSAAGNYSSFTVGTN